MGLALSEQVAVATVSGFAAPLPNDKLLRHVQRPTSYRARSKPRIEAEVFGRDDLDFAEN
jgi:hypothetical protein